MIIMKESNIMATVTIDKTPLTDEGMCEFLNQLLNAVQGPGKTSADVLVRRGMEVDTTNFTAKWESQPDFNAWLEDVAPSADSIFEIHSGGQYDNPREITRDGIKSYVAGAIQASPYLYKAEEIRETLADALVSLKEGKTATRGKGKKPLAFERKTA